MLQKLIYSIFVFLSSKFYDFIIFIFRIIFGQTCYGTTVLPPSQNDCPTPRDFIPKCLSDKHFGIKSPRVGQSFGDRGSPKVTNTWSIRLKL